MIMGTHVLLYSTDPDADRLFLGKVLGMPSVDAGAGWPIFRLPPAEVAVHPGEPLLQRHRNDELMSGVIYLMCDDLEHTLADLDTQGVPHGAPEREPWGIASTITLPSGGRLGLYQPTHPTALELER